jgi:probable blue pigment (indigoidine) exporter
VTVLARATPTIASPDRPNQGRLLATTAFTPAAWGTTYIVATELLPSGRPLFAATARALPVGLVFLLRTRRRPRGIWWWRCGVLGFLNIGAFFAFLFVAAFRLPGGVAATAGGIQPLVASAVAVVVLGEQFTTRIAFAGMVGIVGVALLVLGPEARLDPVGLAASLGGTVSMAVGVVLTKRWGRPVDLITFTGWQLIAGAAMLVPFMLWAEGLPSHITITNLAGLAWLAIVGTALAYSLWFRGIQILPVTKTSFLVLLSPLVATILGWVVLEQRLTSVQLIGAALVAGAVLLPQVRLRSALTSGSA